jgi:hypothetical protein
VDDIQSEIDKFKQENFGKFTLGLQIRRVGGSKLNDTQEDILWNCASEMSTIHHNDVVWFLATDNEATRQRALSEFGSKVKFYNKTISRADTEGIKAGIVGIHYTISIHSPILYWRFKVPLISTESPIQSALYSYT